MIQNKIALLKVMMLHGTVTLRDIIDRLGVEATRRFLDEYPVIKSGQRYRLMGFEELQRKLREIRKYGSDDYGAKIKLVEEQIRIMEQMALMMRRRNLD